MRTKNKEQQWRMSKKGKLLPNIFFNKLSFLRCPEILCLFVIIPLAHGSVDSVDQSTDAVCRSNSPAVPGILSRSQYPNRGVFRESTAQCSVRITPIFVGGNVNWPAPSGGNVPKVLLSFVSLFSLYFLILKSIPFCFFYSSIQRYLYSFPTVWENTP